jgi:hypothetical protein
MIDPATLWNGLEAEAKRLDALQATTLSMLPKRPSQKLLRTFDVSIRVCPGKAPATFVQTTDMADLTAGLSAHAALQRARWHAEVVSIAADILALLVPLHQTLVDRPGFSDCGVLAVDATPKIEPATLWMSKVGHVMAMKSQGFTIADGEARKAYTPVLSRPVDQDAPTWLLTFADRRGFTAFDSVVLSVRANTLEDALHMAKVQHPHRFQHSLDNLHAARLVEDSALDLAKHRFATT